MNLNLNDKLEINPKNIIPYGDSTNDGAIQFSFTLPIPYGALAKESARQYVINLGFEKAEVVTMEDLGEGFSFFVVYGHTSIGIDITGIKVVEVDFEHMDREEVDEYIHTNVKRPIVVVGATIESDAHTVGLDAILNMKGYHGDYGLERYKMFEVYNLGSQVPCEDVIKKIKETNADAVLISQIVTQRNIHIHNLTRFMDLLESENIRKDIITIVGGPRIGHDLAIELGYDAGFGPGTIPSQVASYISTNLNDKIKEK